MASSFRASVFTSQALQLRNSGITPRAAITSISLETLLWPSTSSQRTTALLMTSWKMPESTQAL